MNDKLMNEATFNYLVSMTKILSDQNIYPRLTVICNETGESQDISIMEIIKHAEKVLMAGIKPELETELVHNNPTGSYH